MKKKEAEKGIAWDLVFAFLRWWALSKWAQSMTFLTRYEPFSLLSDNYIFHYNNRKLHRVRDAIWKKYHIPSGLLDRDNYFFYMYFDKTLLPFGELKDFLKNTEVMVSEEDDFIRVVIPRE